MSEAARAGRGQRSAHGVLASGGVALTAAPNLLTEYTPERRHGKRYDDSYSAPRETLRIRLSAAESRPVRYCLSEWSGEFLASTMPTQVALIAEREASGEERTDESGIRLALAKTGGHEAQTIHCSPSRSSSFHGWELTQMDRWCDVRGGERGAERRERIRAWRALRAMADARDPSLIVLQALFGDRAPGLPSPGLWDRSTDWDYCRLARFCGNGWSGAALDAAVLVDRRQRDGETDAQTKERVARRVVARAALLRELGIECERMIVAAAVAYRMAFRDA